MSGEATVRARRAERRPAPAEGTTEQVGARRAKRIGRVHGVLLVDKPAGVSSFQAVDRIRRAAGAGKAGHAGTLDPLATGLLVVCLGEATKLTSFLLGSDKEYSATVTLGLETDTLDRTGRVTRERAVPDLAVEAVGKAVAALEGERLQSPPAFSAAKHRGRPLYAWARQGVEVDKPPKRVTILRAELAAFRPEDRQLDLAVTCSAGTYVRVLAAELGEALGCGGHLTELRRTRSGPFDLAAARTPEEIEALASRGRLAEILLGLDLALGHLPGLVVAEAEAADLRQGRIPETCRATGPGPDPATNVLRRAHTAEGDLVAVLEGRGAESRIVRVFHPTVARRDPEGGPGEDRS
jgi:tRNA pseudouridine55 synthase